MADGRAGPRETPETERAARLIGQLDALRTTDPMVADVPSRVISRIIDAVAFFLFLLATDFLALEFIGHEIPSGTGKVMVLDTDQRVAFFAFHGIVILLNEVVAVGVFGRTFGHRVMKLEIIRLDGGRPGIGRAAVRFLVTGLPVLALLALWSLLWPEPASIWPFLGTLAVPALFVVSIWKNNDGRGFHDRVAGTAVQVPR